MNIGMAGEFRCVVRRSNGDVKLDTGYQKNIFLNAGLNALSGAESVSIFANCVIGSGNSIPTYTQDKLDSIITKQNRAVEISRTAQYNPITDGTKYKTNVVYKYTYENKGDINISEVGLATKYTNNTNYSLVTRALIRDSNGEATVISLLSDEILDIYYRVWCVFDTQDVSGVINLTDANGIVIPYNYVGRLAVVNSSNVWNYEQYIGKALSTPYSESESWRITSGELGNIYNKPTGTVILSDSSYIMRFGAYIEGSYKRSGFWDLGTNQVDSSNIRSLVVKSSMGIWQFRYGSVLDDSPITKNSNQKMTFEFEFSWGRYEGEL